MTATAHPGGGFDRPEPTTSGGPDYGRFISVVRDLQDHVRAVDAPDDVITKAADLIEDVNALLTPYHADEWTSPSGRRLDLPSRGNLLPVPMRVRKDPDDRVRGTCRFRRYHLGRNGAAHGGAIGLLFDSVLGTASVLVTGNRYQRTAYLHLDYRALVPIDKELQLESWVRDIDRRKIFVNVRLSDGDTLCTEGEALFVQLKPGQP
ncbi:MAG: PaaI family thioesterase [Mycobacterium sp.]